MTLFLIIIGVCFVVLCIFAGLYKLLHPGVTYRDSFCYCFDISTTCGYDYGFRPEPREVLIPVELEPQCDNRNPNVPHQ